MRLARSDGARTRSRPSTGAVRAPVAVTFAVLARILIICPARHACTTRPPPLHPAQRGPRVRSALPSLVLLTAVAGCAGRTSAPDAGTAGARSASAPSGIDRAALERRLTAFAHDSMEGRRVGQDGARRAAAYIAAEAARLGLQPAGENGSYYQVLPFVRRVPSEARLAVGSKTFEPFRDYAVVDLGAGMRTVDGVPSVYGGSGDDLVSAEEAAGKLVVLSLAPGGTLQGIQSLARDRFAGAAGIALLNVYNPQPAMVAQLRRGQLLLPDPKDSAAPTPVVIALGVAASTALVPGAAPAKGTALGVARGDVRPRAVPQPSYNVLAALPGSDPAVRGQYVAFGAHLDHVGFRTTPVDHDSLRAFNAVVRPGGADDGEKPATEADWPKVRALLDSLRASRPARLDSIHNGADDDASGSMGVLGVAEAFARGPRPRRSLLFVWHTAEELGMVGARWFTDRPTVPLDSIVAQLNVDMIGRGGAQDLPNGGPGYVQLIGSRRLSTELGDLVERTNAQRQLGFTFDYAYDANGHPAQYYCRSDHYMYARFGIPIVFFSTGGHRDYHMVTDETAYIDFAKLTRVSQLIHDVGAGVANLDHRVAVDKPKPDPNGQCVQ
jgi:hypothetical protein